jgi:hypothetical protein
VFDHEIAHADRTHFSVGEKLLECSVRTERPLEIGGEGLVEDEEIDLLDPEFAGALLETVQGLAERAAETASRVSSGGV